MAAKSHPGLLSEVKSGTTKHEIASSFETPRTPARIRRQHLIIEIRRMVGNGHSYRSIMDTLGIPERSFYRYLSQAFEHDRRQLQEQDRDNLALEIRVLHDRLTNAYRRLAITAANEEVVVRDRIDAEAAACEVALAIAKLAFEGPIVLKDFRRICADGSP